MIEYFLAQKGSQNLSNICDNVEPILDLFFRFLELFGGLLGGFLGPPRLSWKALDPKNMEKPNVVLKVFANVGFRYFEALDGPLGPILAPLGPIWSKMNPQNCPKSDPTNSQKLVQKTTPN